MDPAHRLTLLTQNFGEEVTAAILGVEHAEVEAFSRNPAVLPAVSAGGGATSFGEYTWEGPNAITLAAASGPLVDWEGALSDGVEQFVYTGDWRDAQNPGYADDANGTYAIMATAVVVPGGGDNPAEESTQVTLEVMPGSDGPRASDSKPFVPNLFGAVALSGMVISDPTADARTPQLQLASALADPITFAWVSARVVKLG